MICNEYLPSVELQPYIKSYIFVEDVNASLCNRTMSIYPSGHLEMIISYGDSVIFSREDYHLKNANGYLGGQILEPMYYTCLGKLKVFSVIFKPWGIYSIIHIPQSEFTSRTIDLDMVFGPQAHELFDRICSESDHAGKIAVLENYFKQLLFKMETQINPVIYAAGLIDHANGKCDIKQISDKVNISLKTLERNFNRLIGLTPKEFSRVLRFNKVFNCINAGESNIHDLVYEYGYYDQSHFINEFREFTSLTPSSFLNKEDNDVDYSLREKVTI